MTDILPESYRYNEKALCGCYSNQEPGAGKNI